jgi:hypothetical protein
VHSVVSVARNIDAPFFILWWAQCRFNEKRAGTRYVELVFFHSVGSAGHIVHYGAPECETSMHYFSYSGGAGMVSTKKRIKTHYAELVFLHLVGSVGHIVHRSVSGV